MVRQKKHIRRSKYGKRFVAGTYIRKFPKTVTDDVLIINPKGEVIGRMNDKIVHLKTWTVGRLSDGREVVFKYIPSYGRSFWVYYPK